MCYHASRFDTCCCRACSFAASRGVRRVSPSQQIHIGGLFGLDKGNPITPNLLSPPPPLRKLTARSHPCGADRLDAGEVTTGRGDSQAGVKAGWFVGGGEGNLHEEGSEEHNGTFYWHKLCF